MSGFSFLKPSIWWLGYYVHPLTQLRCSVLSNFDPCLPPAKWCVQAILPHAIKLGRGWLATKNTEVQACTGSKPCLCSLYESLLPLGKDFKDSWPWLRAIEHVLGHHKPFCLMRSNRGGMWLATMTAMKYCLIVSGKTWKKGTKSIALDLGVLGQD
jgi:hypothetical protein